MALQSSVGKHACGADLYQIPAELVLEDAVFEPPEIHRVAQPERIEVISSGVIPIESDAALALDAAIHLVVHQRPEILIPERALREGIMAGNVTGHHGHILKVAL